MFPLSTSFTTSMQRILRSGARISRLSPRSSRQYTGTLQLQAAVNHSPSRTHPHQPGLPDGTSAEEGYGISVHQRLSEAKEHPVSLNDDTSFGFAVSGRESTLGGKAKSQGRPIYLDMQVGFPSYSSS